MKNFNLSQFLGCCVIAVSIIIAGSYISEEIPDTTQVPDSLYVSTQNQYEQYANCMSKYEVAEYFDITVDDVYELLNSGELDGTYTMVGETYIFSREKLDEWVKNSAK